MHLNDALEQTKLIHGGKVTRMVFTSGSGVGTGLIGKGTEGAFRVRVVLYLDKGLGCIGVRVDGTLKIYAFHCKFYLERHIRTLVNDMRA